MKVANLALSDVALFWFSSNGHLQIKTCRNVQCDIMIQGPEEQFCALF